ncbi:MAG TPA: vitamin K epoxide reductase family protein [Terracidiphilus sp.]|nr:vitamin K epoxide reductase family protein [Terracidiphilus sp.]
MRYLVAAIALAGVVVSALALHVHYVTGAQPCDINSHWDCGIVNHSSFAMIGPVPVALIGIIGYIIIGLLGFLRMRFLLVLAVFAGFCFALRLTFIEEYALEIWCLYCVISQGIISLLLLLGLGWLGAELYRLRSSQRTA